VLLAALMSVSTTAIAAPLHSGVHHPDSLWNWLASSWAVFGCALVPGSCPGLDAGCELDPHGACQQGISRSQLDAGCELDPHGGCRQNHPQSLLDAGCEIDPGGATCRQVSSSSRLDAGCELDPGGCRAR
jgi:hypothetical protein